MANKFTLKVDRVEVSYTIGATPGISALIYKDQKMSKEFEANEIHTDSTTLGSLLTVTVEVTVDHGGTTFSFFLPSLHVSARAIEFNTIGIYKEVRGQVVAVANQIVSWRTIPMRGTPETVAVPQKQPAA